MITKKDAYIEAITDELQAMPFERVQLVYRLITEDLGFIATIISKLKKFLR